MTKKKKAEPTKPLGDLEEKKDTELSDAEAAEVAGGILYSTYSTTYNAPTLSSKTSTTTTSLSIVKTTSLTGY